MQSFAELGVSRAVVRALAAQSVTRTLRGSDASSSRRPRAAATCSPARPPGRARPSPSESRSSTASRRRAAPRRADPRPHPRAGHPDRRRPARASPTPARCASPPSTAASGLVKQGRDAAPRHIVVATPGPPRGPARSAAPSISPGPDPGARRGRPDARHGLPPRGRPDRRRLPVLAPDAVLLGHARRRGRPRRPRLHPGPRPCTSTVPPRAAPPPRSSTASSPSTATRIEALIAELERERDLAARLRAHQARRRPAGQAPRRPRPRRRGHARQQVPAPARVRPGPLRVRRTSTRWSPPTSPRAGSTWPASRT